MARPINTEPLPAHPAIGTRIETKRIYGSAKPCVEVTCVQCSQVKWYPTATLRAILKKQRFRGICRGCWARTSGARRFRSKRNLDGRRLNENGYVLLSKNAISDLDLPLFDSLRGSGGTVLEHRWVVSKHLGRPLRSDECVDHINGDRSDNELENLRIYVKGLNEPGSCPGAGVYYHEWQMALAKIAELEKLLSLGAHNE